MLTIGDALPTFTLQGGEPDAVGWKATLPTPGSATFSIGLHAAIRLVSPGGLSAGRNRQEAMRVPGTLQSRDLRPRDCPQGGEHLKAA